MCTVANPDPSRTDPDVETDSGAAPVEQGSGNGRLVEETDTAIIWEWSFEPGQNTGWHRHLRDYAVVPLLDGRVRITDKTGTQISEMRRGVPYFREKGVEHDVANAGDAFFRFIEIEFKTGDNAADVATLAERTD
ncbi:MAG: cupin domain-containing protein [Pseudomonadota bacterium]